MQKQQTKEQRIEELEKRCANFLENIERVTERNAELVAAEENTFLHSPTYIKLCESIEFLKDCRKFDEIEIARLKGKIPSLEEKCLNLYKDNKEMLEHLNQSDYEYFIGLTQNWHEAFEYRKQRDEIHRLNGKVEQLKFSLEQRDKEIERLQMALGEKRLQKDRQEQKTETDTLETESQDLPYERKKTKSRAGR